MAREIDVKTLEAAAENYSGLFMLNAGNRDRAWVMGQFVNFTFNDEFEFLVKAMRGQLGAVALADFNARGEKVWNPRSDKTFAGLLAKKLAIDMDGAHIPGRIGTTQLGKRIMGDQVIEVEATDSTRRRKRLGLDKSPGNRELIHKIVPLYWPQYAGEAEERARIEAGERGYDDEGISPVDLYPISGGALNTKISNEIALLMADACVDNLDEGAGAAVIQGRSGAQPADPDTVVSGTLLFTLVCSDPAFGNAADANPGGIATASAITDDSSADATGTLGYCRASSSNDGATPLDDHIDGEAGTSSADWVFNTLAIVSGAVVSATAWTITQPEG